MNHLQKAWLKVLTPLAYLVNEKMAKRNGLGFIFGAHWQVFWKEQVWWAELAAFSRLGPENTEFTRPPSSSPSSTGECSKPRLKLCTECPSLSKKNCETEAIGLLKQVTDNKRTLLDPTLEAHELDPHRVRPGSFFCHFHLRSLGPRQPVAPYFKQVSHFDCRQDKLSYLNKRAGPIASLPPAAMNNITSAHFLEINKLYTIEMLRRVLPSFLGNHASFKNSTLRSREKSLRKET
jgi:hypothetical protein